MCALKLLANLQADGDNLVDTICQGVQEQSRPNTTSELRKFSDADKQEAVEMGDLETYTEVIEVVRPSCQ